MRRPFAERSTPGGGEAEARKWMWAKCKAVEGGRGHVDTQLSPLGRAIPALHRVGCFVLRSGGSRIEEEAKVSTLLMAGCCQQQC